MADTTMDKGAIFVKNEAAQRGSIRGEMAQKAVGEASGRPRGNIQNIGKMKKIGKVEKVQLDKEHLSRKKLTMILTPLALFMEIQADLKFQKE
jgi:hypothetical protein